MYGAMVKGAMAAYPYVAGAMRGRAVYNVARKYAGWNTAKKRARSAGKWAIGQIAKRQKTPITKYIMGRKLPSLKPRRASVRTVLNGDLKINNKHVTINKGKLKLARVPASYITAQYSGIVDSDR